MSTFNGWNIITMPSAPAPKSLEWQMMDVIGVTRSPFSLQRQIFDWQQAKLAASVMMPPMRYDKNSAAWEAFLMQAAGVSNVFAFGDPIRTGPQNPSASGGTTSGTNASGSRVLNCSASGVQAGDWMQVGVRLYRATGAPSGGAVPIWPPIRESISGGSSVLLTNTTGMFCLSKNSRSYKANENKMYNFTFEIEEAL